MTEKTISLYCPKCGERFHAIATEAKSEPFTCAGCGAQVNWMEMKTDTGETLAKYRDNLVRKAFKGIKGFKPRG